MNEQGMLALKWQKLWADAKIFEVKETKKKKFYCLDMFPYPSGNLHMGHARTYSISDCFTRFKRMQGFNVLHPIGYDALGLPAENAAIKNNVHPKEWTENSIALMKHGQKQLGFSYDWSRELKTHDKDYQKWEQWLFLKFYEKGLAYRKNAAVNWCPSCKTVLANEQVINGRCWRCNSVVIERELEQWFFKITEYAEQLLKDIDLLKNWPERVKIMQKNWIGKSSGIEISFKIKNFDEKINVFTTRPDTLYGVTYLVLAPEHPFVEKLVSETKFGHKAKKFIEEVKKESKIERISTDKEKKGVFTGAFAINLVNNEEVPIYIADYALMDYGTGVVMCVPAHDQRDFEFAKKYDLPIKVVINPLDKKLDYKKMEMAFVEEGILTGSDKFNNLNSKEAIEKISDYLEELKVGRRTINYRLRDWLISRQRYWGTPIPVIYCNKCGIVPVPEKELPVLLPEKVKFTGQGNPLDIEIFTKVKCPKCKSNARRETDTMDTFVDSSWYYLRYCSPKFEKGPFDKKAAKYWMPVDTYIGGIEHAILHLLYSRFFSKVLMDMKMIDFKEPFLTLFAHGMVLKNGKVMSKSKGNVVDPEEIIEKYGVDTLRTFLLFGASPEKDMEWSDEGLNGISKFLNRIEELCEFRISNNQNTKDEFLISKCNSTISKVTDNLEHFEFNSALVNLFEYVDYIKKNQNYVSSKVYMKAVETLLLMIVPFAPHLAEERWEKLGNKKFISVAKWPIYDSKKINQKFEAIEYITEKISHDISSVITLTNLKPNKITLFVAEPWKFKFFKQLKKELEKTRDVRELIKNTIEYGDQKEIPRLVNIVLKDSSKIPLFILDESLEFEVLSNERSSLAAKFKAQIEILKASESDEQKARQALPGKPAILIK